MPFKEELQMELADILENDFIEPRTELEKGEREVWEMDITGRKIYTLFFRYQKEFGHAIVDYENSETDEKERQAGEQCARLKKRIEEIFDMLMTHIKNKSGTYGKEFYFRKGFKVAVKDEKNNRSSSPFIIWK